MDSLMDVHIFWVFFHVKVSFPSMISSCWNEWLVNMASWNMPSRWRAGNEDLVVTQLPSGNVAGKSSNETKWSFLAGKSSTNGAMSLHGLVFWFQTIHRFDMSRPSTASPKKIQNDGSDCLIKVAALVCGDLSSGKVDVGQKCSIAVASSIESRRLVSYYLLND